MLYVLNLHLTFPSHCLAHVTSSCIVSHILLLIVPIYTFFYLVKGIYFSVFVLSCYYAFEDLLGPKYQAL